MTVSLYKDRAAFTVSTTELSIVSGTSSLAADTTPGYYTLLIDCANLVKGDDFLVQIKEKAATGSTQRLLQEFHLQNPQSQLQAAVPWPLAVGWDMTIKRLAGADRAFDISIRKTG
jgi:hypothetical protein